MNNDIQAAAALGALEQLRKAELLSVGDSRAELRRLIQAARKRIAALFRANGRSAAAAVRAEITNLSRAIRSWFAQDLQTAANDGRLFWVDALNNHLSNAQKRLSWGFEWTTGKQLVLPPVSVPRFPATTAPPALRDVLSHAWQMFTPPNPPDAYTLALKPWLVAEWNKRKPVAAAVASVRSGVSRKWSEKLTFSLRRFGQQVVEGIRTAGSKVKEFIKKLTGFADELEESVDNENRHEKRKVQGDRDDDLKEVIGDAYLGYVLHSRFLPTTAPDHAARDGWKFYRDNRSGSALPWSQRIIPPYRKNCVCFTIPIFERPTGEEYTEEFGVRLSGGEEIQLRDVGTWSAWFNSQRATVQQTIVGRERWFANAARGSTRQRWSEYHRTDGTMLSASQLLSENGNTRRARIRQVDVIFTARSRLIRQAWEATGERFGSRADLERIYRQQLERAFRRI